MDELLNPAHGISWSAIIFVAGGAWVMLRRLDARVKELEEVEVTSVALTAKLEALHEEIIRVRDRLDRFLDGHYRPPE